jgi:2-keto-myo-inositol isomerase
MASRRRFGLNGATTGSAGLLADLKAAREAGYDALEIRDTKLKAYLEAGGSIPAFRERLTEAKIEAASLNALENSTLRTEVGRKVVLERCRILSESAAGLACPYVVAVPGPHRGAGEAQIREGTREALRGMVEVAKPYNVRIAFEFLGAADCSVRTLGMAREIVEAMGDPAVGLVIDAFHFYVGGSTWEMIEGLDPARLFIVHLDDAEDRPRDQLTDAHRLLPGDGVIPLRELIRRLDTIGYQGVYSIELFRPEYWTWDPVRLAGVARHKMAALFQAP